MNKKDRIFALYLKLVFEIAILIILAIVIGCSIGFVWDKLLPSSLA